MSLPDLYYVSPDDVSSKSLVLRAGEHHHLKDVHRKKRGDLIIAVDGLGNAWTCEIAVINAQSVTAIVRETHPQLGEPRSDVTLAVAVPKKDKFEWILEKATELGVSRIVPLMTERSVVRPGHHKSVRWRKIVIAAMKQCQRARCPQLLAPVAFHEFVSTLPEQSMRFLAHEKAQPTAHLRAIGRGQSTRCIICVGPEGGFTEQEIQRAQDGNFAIVSLGPRRLRTETAAIAAITLIMDRLEHHFGQFA
jgi:16S rRNA (uracil1498-N3)-methyltransferase